MSRLFHAYPLARPALFALDAENAHELTLSSLQKSYDCRLTRKLFFPPAPHCPTHIMGLAVRNPVGLAAGLDKNGSHIDALGALGFGFVEVGTVTPRAQSGNPRPRMFRLPRAQALINRMGFNNLGLQTFIQNVQRSTWRQQGGILGLNIGKNADTPIENAVDDYLLGLAGVYPHADYITINISSPNTQNLRALQQQDELAHLLRAVTEQRKALADAQGRHVPIAVKVAPDLDTDHIAPMADTLVQFGIEGLIATNTTLSRDAVQGQPHAHEAGGLSGKPLHQQSLHIIRQFRQHLGSQLSIIGVGGIHSGQDAHDKIQAGADAVQLYTGLIYQGPGLIADSVQALQPAYQGSAATS